MRPPPTATAQPWEGPSHRMLAHATHSPAGCGPGAGGCRLGMWVFLARVAGSAGSHLHADHLGRSIQATVASGLELVILSQLL